MICPGASGGKNWPAGAYSPLTNTMYMPMQNMCMDAVTRTDQRDPSLVYGINMPNRCAPGADNVGTVWAISARRARPVEARAARGHDVAGRDRRRPGVRRRRRTGGFKAVSGQRVPDGHVRIGPADPRAASQQLDSPCRSRH
jgi:hypothetical protein